MNSITNLLDRVDPRFLNAYAWGDYDQLFSAYQRYVSPEVSGSVHLASSGKKSTRWAVLRPETTRAAEVLWSNFLPYGAKVRSTMPLGHASRRRRWDTIDTIGDPRWLDVTYIPAKKGQTKARLMRHMRKGCQRRAA